MNNTQELKTDAEGFFRAGVNLLLWKEKLTAFLNDKGSALESEEMSYQRCGLGKWLYSGQMVKYRTTPEMQNIEQAHTEIHDIAKRIIELKNGGRFSDVNQGLNKIGQLTQKILSLLTKLECQILQPTEKQLLNN